MAYSVFFSDEAVKDMDRLDKKVLLRIIRKIKWFALRQNPLDFAARLTYNAIGEYRYRVGDYRVIFDYKEQEIIILRMGHRSSIYK